MQPTPPPAGDLDPHYGFAGCYRHPDRLTGVRCIRCNRPICPQCQHAASVGFQCPDDVRAGAATIRRPRSALGAPLRTGAPIVTYALVGLNVLIYLFTGLSSGGSFSTSSGRWFNDWVMQPAAVAHGHEFYRLLTGAFLHVSPLHLILNMWVLYVIGGALEPVMGRLRYLAVYLLAALGGSVAVLVFGEQYGAVAGASGAIYGLFAAALVVARLRGVFQFRPLLITVVINFALTFSLAGISKLGHIGGFVVGGIAMLVLLGLPWPDHGAGRRWARSPAGQWTSLAAILAVLLAITASQVS